MVGSSSSCSSSCPRDHHKLLPNDLLDNILKRLPAENLLRFKQASRQWYSLISTPDFHHMHLSYGGANNPTIVVVPTKPNPYTFEILLLEDNVERKIKKRIMFSKNMNNEVVNTNNKQLMYLKFAYHGFILFVQYPRIYTIFNPITREQVTFQLDEEKDHILAFFFHPFAKEYYALIWKIPVPEVKLLTLNSLLSNHLDSAKKLSLEMPFLIPTKHNILPGLVIKRDAIYWLVSCSSIYYRTTVLIFDIKEEEFHVVSHPLDNKTCNKGHSSMHLFEKADCVSICIFDVIEYDQVTMHVWDLLEGHTWSERQTIILQMKPFPFNGTDWKPWPVGTLNGELIINWKGRGVFAYNLRLGSLRRLEDSMTNCVAIHTKSILSLKSLLQKA